MATKKSKNNTTKASANKSKTASKNVANLNVAQIKSRLRAGEVNLIAAKTGVSASQVYNVFAGRRSDNSRILATAAKMTARRK
jgi:hypothetical protein